MAVFLGVHKLPEGMQEADMVKGWEDYKTNATAAGPARTSTNTGRAAA